MFYALTSLGTLVVIGLASVSIVANFWFGTLLTTGDERTLYGVLFALLDGLKTLLLPLAATAATARLLGKSWAAVLVFILLSALSFTAEVGLYATTKSETVGDAKAAKERYQQARDAKTTADAAVAAFGAVRPLGDIKGEIAALKRDRLYDRSAKCTDATALDSRDLCARLDRLAGERDKAIEYAEASRTAQATAVDLGKQNVAAAMRVIDPQAEALAKLLSPVLAVDAETVRTGLAVFIALLIELGSGLGPWLVMPAPRAAVQSLEAPTKPPVKTAPPVRAAAPVPKPETPPAKVEPPPTAPLAEDDAVARWASSALVKRRGAYVRAGEAREAFNAWCTTEGKKPPNRTAFGKAMRAAGFGGRKIGGVQRYEGIALVSAKRALRVVVSNPEPERPAPAAEPTPPPRIVGNVQKFAAARVRSCPGERTTIDEAYGNYLDWCADLKLPPVDKHRFKPSFVEFCKSSGVDLKEIGERAYCIDVKLAG